MNPHIAAPRSPGRWVNETRCVCGARYRAHRGSYGFAEAAQRLRQLAHDDGDESGGFRSRGPVLWVLRTLKLQSWYEEHYMCGSLVVRVRVAGPLTRTWIFRQESRAALRKGPV